MRRLLAPLLVLAMSVGLLSAAPLTASAAPPTSTWAGGAGGSTAGVGLDLIGVLDLADVALATSRADAGSQRTPDRATARSANLGATVAGLGLSVADNVVTAGPDAETNTRTRSIGATVGGSLVSV